MNNFWRISAKINLKCCFQDSKLSKEEVILILLSSKYGSCIWIRKLEKDETSRSMSSEWDSQKKASRFELAERYREKCHLWIRKEQSHKKMDKWLKTLLKDLLGE